MAVKIFSAAVLGLQARPVEVEADLGGGELGSFAVVGLPDAAVSEARERVRAAVKNSGFNFPKLKITVNLAPAHLKKHGPLYDLPIALSVLAASGKLTAGGEVFNESWFAGELALDGALRSVAGILPMALAAQEIGVKNFFVPSANAREAKLAGDLNVYAINNLAQLVAHLQGSALIEPLASVSWQAGEAKSDFDFAHISGQEHAKRALEIAAAGGHNVLMSGPPGSGKTMLARALLSILPPLSLAEALEVTKIYSVAGELLAGEFLINCRPWRSPHHSASVAAIIGGGTWPKPGEISLAHRGVLFLDEFGEFPRPILESLRQPLEDGIVTVSRAAGSLIFPAKFILAAAMNPCPCGFLYDQQKPCTCSASQVATYRRKLSGPILDRLDLHLEVPRLEFKQLIDQHGREVSAAVKARVAAARFVQGERFVGTPFLTNSDMSSEAVRRWCPLDEASKKLLEQAVNQLNLSPRAFFRSLKLARTIADLAGAAAISQEHLAEALQYRTKN